PHVLPVRQGERHPGRVGGRHVIRGAGAGADDGATTGEAATGGGGVGVHVTTGRHVRPAARRYHLVRGERPPVVPLVPVVQVPRRAGRVHPDLRVHEPGERPVLLREADRLIPGVPHLHELVHEEAVRGAP